MSYKNEENPYIEKFVQSAIEKYGENKIIESGIVAIENERKITNLAELASHICCITECENCPVHIHNYEKRTEEEKVLLHTLCVNNLYKWIIDEAIKANKED